MTMLVTAGTAAAGARGRLLDRVRADLDRLDPSDFLWEGEVICAVAAKDGSA